MEHNNVEATTERIRMFSSGCTTKILPVEDTSLEERIIGRAEELERTVMSSSEIPEISIDENKGFVTINRYNESLGASYLIEEFCNVANVNFRKLRALLNNTSIAYVF